jgi:hypothetical protein
MLPESCALHALTAGERHLPLTSRAHHDRSGQAHTHARSLWHDNRRAAVGHHVCPPTSPTTRVAAAPEKACLQCITMAVTVGIKWPGPVPSKDDPRVARARGLKNPTLEGCNSTGGLEAHSVRVRATGGLDSQGLLISGSCASPISSPRVLQMQNVRGTQLPPRSGPTDQGFEA